jgi:putative membrane protein
LIKEEKTIMMWDWGFRLGGVLMIFFWLFVAAMIVVVVVLAVNSTKSSSDGSSVTKSGQDRALQEARERYARGEINREEYKQLVEDLKE